MSNEIIFFWLLILLAFVTMVLGGFFVRALKRKPTLRSIPGYDALPTIMDASLETNQPVHVSLGSAAVGQQSTITALASMSVIYQLVERQAFTNQLPLFTLTDPVSLAIAQDTVRRAYIARQNREAYRNTAVMWFPQSERSLAFGAGASAISVASKAGSNVMLGQFGTELAYIGEASARYDQNFVGHSTSLEGQAVAFAQSEAPVIGEELFVGGAYSSPESSFELGGVIALDVLRWVAIAAIIVIAISNA